MVPPVQQCRSSVNLDTLCPAAFPGPELPQLSFVVMSGGDCVGVGEEEVRGNVLSGGEVCGGEGGVERDNCGDTGDGDKGWWNLLKHLLCHHGKN